MHVANSLASWIQVNLQINKGIERDRAIMSLLRGQSFGVQVYIRNHFLESPSKTQLDVFSSKMLKTAWFWNFTHPKKVRFTL